MGRMIDADVLIEALEQEKQKFQGNTYQAAICMVENTIKRQPTAYDVDAVVEQIHNELFCYDVPSEPVEEIVRKGGVE